MTDSILYRCGRTTKNGSACRTPVVHAGAARGSHRSAVQKYDSRKTANRTQTEQNLVAAFMESYRCPGCDAGVEFFTAGPAQPIVVGHDSTCPQLVERVSRRSA